MYTFNICFCHNSGSIGPIRFKFDMLPYYTTTVSRNILNRNRIYDRAKFLITGLGKIFIDGRRLPYQDSYSFYNSDWIQIRLIAYLWSINKISKMFEKNLLEKIRFLVVQSFLPPDFLISKYLIYLIYAKFTFRAVPSPL